MKRIVFAAAMAFSAVPALAADLPQAAPPPPQAPATYIPTVAPVYNWSGIYFGINGGFGYGQSNWSPAGGTATGNFNFTGGLVGSTLGVNFQTGGFVFGVEGDIDWSTLKGSVTNTTTCGTVPASTCTFQTENDWLGTVRGRVGYAWDRVLVYGTAGGAFGNIKANFTNITRTGFTATNNTEFGWTAGGGLEVAVTHNFTARVEYLFVDLSNGSLACTVAAGCGATLAVPVSFNASLVRAGLDYKFGGF